MGTNGLASPSIHSTWSGQSMPARTPLGSAHAGGVGHLALADPRVSACTPAAGIQCHVCRRELHARFVTWVTAAKDVTWLHHSTAGMHSRDGSHGRREGEGEGTQQHGEGIQGVMCCCTS